MLADSISNVFARSSTKSLLVGVGYGGNWTVPIVFVTGEVGCVVRPFVVVRECGPIETVNGICAGEVLLAQMVGSVSSLGVLADYVEWTVRHVPWVAFTQRTSATQPLAIFERVLGSNGRIT
jgi:hypothetical protein